MKKNYINVVVKAPGEAAKITQIENTLEAFQKIVGGYIETFTIATDCTIVCNEEGLLIGLPYNCRMFGADFYGTVMLCGVKGEDFCDIGLTNRQLKLLFPSWFTEGSEA